MDFEVNMELHRKWSIVYTRLSIRISNFARKHFGTLLIFCFIKKFLNTRTSSSMSAKYIVLFFLLTFAVEPFAAWYHKKSHNFQTLSIAVESFLRIFLFLLEKFCQFISLVSIFRWDSGIYRNYCVSKNYFTDEIENLKVRRKS